MSRRMLADRRVFSVQSTVHVPQYTILGWQDKTNGACCLERVVFIGRIRCLRLYPGVAGFSTAANINHLGGAASRWTDR